MTGQSRNTRHDFRDYLRVVVNLLSFSYDAAYDIARSIEKRLRRQGLEDEGEKWRRKELGRKDLARTDPSVKAEQDGVLDGDRYAFQRL